MKIKNVVRNSAIVVFAAFLMTTYRATTAPQMNRIEPLPSHSVFGIDPYPPSTEGREKGDWLTSFQISPYYQDAPGSRDDKGNEVAIGAEHGSWNTAGIFYGVLPAVDDAYGANDLPNSTWAGTKPAGTGENYEKFKAALELLDTKYTNTADNNFDTANITDAAHSVAVDFKRLGVRGEIRLALFEGADITIRGGACEYRMTPTTLEPLASADSDVTKYLLTESKLDEIMNEVGLS